MKPKVLVLYYSTYGHVETLASAIAEGARAVDGAEVIVKREAAPLTRATKQPGGEAAIK